MSVEAVETSTNIDRVDVAYVMNSMEDGPPTGIAADPELDSADPQSATTSPDDDNLVECTALLSKTVGGSLLEEMKDSFSPKRNNSISNPDLLLNYPKGANSTLNITEASPSTDISINRETEVANYQNKVNLTEKESLVNSDSYKSATSELTNTASTDSPAVQLHRNDENIPISKLDNTPIDKLDISEKIYNPESTDMTRLPRNNENVLNPKLESIQINNTYNDIKLKLATSSTSLNDQQLSETSSLSKTLHSKSAENISSASTNSNLNSSTKEMNTEKILLDFSSQKPKVTAIHQLPEALLRPEPLDVKHTRLPKELSQDIGSIVKNVHGIFSSVSGSLKNAYNQSQRGTTQKQKTVRPIPNGKVMDDIFEDENTIEQIRIQNEPEKMNGTNLKMEQNQDLNNVQTPIDAKTDVLHLQIETLERILAEQRNENTSLRERVKQQLDEMQEKDQAFKELETKLDVMWKRVETAERDKDAAVMRYASVECAAIEARRAAEKSAQAERNALAETELANAKLKSAHAEKQRICQLYDDKCHELSTSERELAKVREDLKELEGRLKWTQSKLRMEMDAYKDSSERAEKLSLRVSDLEAAREASSAAASAVDAAKVKQLESELSECQAALILCRHERDGLERRVPLLTRQLQEAERARDGFKESAESAQNEVSLLRAANSSLEQEAAELAALRAQAALADTLAARLQRETVRASQAEELARQERARADTCARREAAALEHGAKVTARHVAATDAAETAMAKAQALEVDNSSLRSRALALESERDALMSSLRDESERRDRENRVLARKVAELTEELNETNKKLEWEKGEIDVLKKKHANAIKELNRELHRAVKRCDLLEAKLQPPEVNTRTESVSSLSSGESVLEDSRPHNGHADSIPDIQVREPDRQALIERIVSLQRAAARRAERCDFLEEHSRQLTTELRKKSKLLRSLLCSMPAGAVASEDSDAHKKEIARLGGGAMAAVWGGDPNGMTIELSLEMNKKLQAVLEDALLKNITLKENMDTLGEEISKLKSLKATTTDSKKD